MAGALRLPGRIAPRRPGVRRPRGRASSCAGGSRRAPHPLSSSARPSPPRRTRCSPARSTPVCASVSGRGIQTVGPASAAALLTSEDAAIGLARDEIARWHGRDAGGPASDARTALAQVAVVPRFSLAVTAETLGRLGDLYADVRRRTASTSTRTSTRTTGRATARSPRCATCTASRRYLDTYDGRHPARVADAAARACSAGAASWPMPCTAPTASCTASPRPAPRSRTARRRSSSSAAARCRGGAPSHRERTSRSAPTSAQATSGSSRGCSTTATRCT